MSAHIAENVLFLARTVKKHLRREERLIDTRESTQAKSLFPVRIVITHAHQAATWTHTGGFTLASVVISV